jgi:hypothetical protein
MLDGFWAFLKDPANRAVIGWIGAGIVAIASGLWAVVRFYARKGDGGSPPGTIRADRSSVAIGRDNTNSPSKYPPAKPGALGFWPLKAAGGVADAAPGIVSRSKRLSGARTRPRIQSATEVAVSARGSSAPNAGPPAPGS